jgi:hypothetical protein
LDEQLRFLPLARSPRSATPNIILRTSQ